MEDRIGYRWFEFKEHGPFFLNGERLLLRGTHRHEDFAGFGPAMPDSLHRRDIQTIKEMGANFVRLAHYPQDPEVYRACDELGVLVWDELPWCRGGMGGDVWKANTVRLLEEQIDWTYNHPSIIIQSLGNEMYWLPDVPGGDHLDSLRSMVALLHRVSKERHPGRVTATRKFTEGADLVDVVSPSLWPGWYSGNYKGFEKAITDSRNRFARFFHAEYGGDSHVGRHTETPVSGDAMNVPEGWEENIKPQKVKNVALDSDWSESYIVDLFDWYLSVSERIPWFTGNAQWAFKDFPTPLRPENPIPYMNQKGLVDRAGRPKDAYYVFKSYWTTAPEFCYIESHSWPERVGPPGVKREVNVFSNCPEVELLVNGKSQGSRTRQVGQTPAAGLSWQVAFEEGKNDVVAIGRKGGTVRARDTVSLLYRTTRNEPADHLTVSSDPQPDGSILVKAVAVDKNGRTCVDYQRPVYFTLDGGGRLAEYDGTPTGSRIIQMANGKASIRFTPDVSKRAVIEVRNQDFKGEYLVFPAARSARQ
jgi:beta-galactosidase